ncbi:MAG: hypothetical protein ACREI3_06280, partial [Nitrospirales bacterium]
RGGALRLLVPRGAAVGGLLLGVTMVGATLTQVMHGEMEAVPVLTDINQILDGLLAQVPTVSSLAWTVSLRPLRTLPVLLIAGSLLLAGLIVVRRPAGIVQSDPHYLQASSCVSGPGAIREPPIYWPGPAAYREASGDRQRPGTSWDT